VLVKDELNTVMLFLVRKTVLNKALYTRHHLAKFAQDALSSCFNDTRDI
jgi:hypothetical protein